MTSITRHASLAAVLALGAAAATFTTTDAIAGDGCGASAACGAAAPAALMGSLAADDIVDTAVKAGKFTTLVAAVQAAGLVDALKGEGPFTVFAPDDAAFGKLADGTIESLLKPENRAQLVAILTHHVVPGRLMASDVTRMDGAVTLGGQKIDFAADGGVRIDGAKVLAADIETSNGVIHVIDSVILPTSDSIVDLASSAGTFNTLLAAAKAAGLAEVLATGGPFTVFAPTDEAFAALPEGTVAALLQNPEQLAAILKYHVVNGRAYAADAVKAGRVATLQGGEIVFSIRNGRLAVDGATIIASDLDASNGVVHVIDKVILPTSN
ncbi:MAG: fasciclin domain-containing protein [Planctomycetota bacterium]|mgnify:CR=1 FL=1|jgi:uncharacterized surface protein with fasciclin (FAS1) repeats